MVVFKASRDAALEELELDTTVEAAVGFPGDVLVTLLTEVQRTLAIDTGDRIIVGIEEVADTVVALLTVLAFSLIMSMKEFFGNQLSLLMIQAPSSDQTLPHRCPLAKREEPSRQTESRLKASESFYPYKQSLVHIY